MMTPTNVFTGFLHHHGITPTGRVQHTTALLLKNLNTFGPGSDPQILLPRTALFIKQGHLPERYDVRMGDALTIE